MYHHVKKLMYTVRVDSPAPKFGNMLLEQFGGANGELAAAMQYSIQGLNCEDPGASTVCTWNLAANRVLYPARRGPRREPGSLRRTAYAA
jgi:Manganese containing catalase